MADNRMAIVCKKCNLGIAIAKRYQGFIWSNYPLNATRMVDFFLKHGGCGEQGYGAHQYRLGYEDEDDWEYDDVGIPKPLPLRTVYKGQRPPKGTYAASIYDLAVEWRKVKEAFYEAFPWPKRAVDTLLKMINFLQRRRK